jgi:prevent-host-death family protein
MQDFLPVPGCVQGLPPRFGHIYIIGVSTLSAVMPISASLLDNRAMTEMSVTGARSRLSEAVDTARVSHEPVYLLRRGRRVAALIDADDLAELVQAAEDLEDLRAAESARREMAESGELPVPWEEVKAELGLA